MDFDVIIVGAGPAGLSMACALASLELRLAVIDTLPETELAEPAYDGREIALTQHSIRLLKQLGIWSRIAEQDISPLVDARVRNGNSGFALEFSHEDGQAESLGSLVSNHDIRRAAWESARSHDNITWLCGARIEQHKHIAHGRELQLADGQTLNCKLLVAADGRFSRLRRDAGISVQMHDFGKTMLVCRMQHELDHEQIAQEWFAYGGTIALLPLNEQRCSAVITETAQSIAGWQDLDDAAFARRLEQRLNRQLGAMKTVSERYAYPLVATWADRFSDQRMALIGDAAVGMHPVTAHGFNLGLRSQDALYRALRELFRQGGNLDNVAALNRALSRFQTEHRQHALPLFLGTNALVKLYTDDRLPAKLLRGALLRASNRATPFRRLIARSLSQS